MIYAVDFDGTLCSPCWPDIGAPNKMLIEWLRNERKKGAKVILWTCRQGNELRAAVEWCDWMGLEFDAINENIKENQELYKNDSRKIYADYYIDDKAVDAITFSKMIKVFEKEEEYA